MNTRYVDLNTLLPNIRPDFSNYFKCEREVLTPALAALGYIVHSWFTGEGDSFGPLTRCALLTKNGDDPITVVYG